VRWSCVILALLIFLAMIYGLIALVMPQLTSSVMGLFSSIPTYTQNFSRWLEEEMEKGFLANSDVYETFMEYYNSAIEYLTNNLVPQARTMIVNITSGVFDVLTFVKNFLIGSLISLYIMADSEKFVGKAKMAVYALMPIEKANILIRSMRYTGETFGGFISGKIIDSIIIGMICYIGCSLMSMPYDLLVSVVIGVTNMIPFFGPFLGAIPSILLILLVDPLKCLYFMIFILVLQQFDGNILGPKILGDSTGLSSFMVIVAILIGGGFFGAVGMLIGVPCFAVLYTGFEYLTQRSLRMKHITDQTDQFILMDCLDPETRKPLPLVNEPKHTDPQPDKRPSLLIRLITKLWNAIAGFLITVFKFVWGPIAYAAFSIRKWFSDKFNPHKRGK
jgi:predicted PurR-regulated permease PerM